MSSFHARRNTMRYQSMELGEEPIVSIASRSMYHSAITEAPVLDDMGTATDWDLPQRSTSLHEAVSEPMWEKIRNGAPIAELIATSPEEVITALSTHTVKKLGSFKMRDADVLLAFGKNVMLTRGSEIARESNYRENWEEAIRKKVKKHQHYHRQFLQENAWEQNVTVAAYVVNIKHAAAGRSKGLLSPLVQKSQSGAASNDIFDLPAVRAVIQYKWHHWARGYLVVEFGLYLGAVLCFAIFLATYIDGSLDKDLDEHGSGGRFLEVESSFFLLLSAAFMIPFLIIEFNTICSYGMRWIQMWNIIDSASYILQFIILFCYFGLDDLTKTDAYNTVLALQCVLLFTKMQYFIRVFGDQTSFVELLARVITKARWFFVFIILSMISVALAFAVLFKEDADDKDHAESADDFSSTVRSVVTTYAVLLGDFNSAYVFDGSNRVVKGLFFLLFQVMMSITVLNLLIAVMTDSYAWVVTKSRIMYNIGRAELMDELEVALPKMWGPDLPPFCHFLIVEKEQKMNTSLSGELSTALSMKSFDSMQNEIKQLSKKVDAMSSKLEKLVQGSVPDGGSGL